MSRKHSLSPLGFIHGLNRSTFAIALLLMASSLSFAFQIRIDNNPESQLSVDFNLIENGGFEMGMVAPFTAGALNGNLSLTSDPMNVHGGAYALEYTANAENSYTSPWNGSGLQVYQDDTTYRFSAWVKAAEPDTRVRLFIFSKKNNQTSSPYWTGQNFIVGTTWQQIEITHYSPPEYDQVAIRLDNRDVGTTVYWDDLRLVPVQNQFPNPGFETGKIHFSRAARGTLSTDTAQAHTGLSSLRHEATGDDSTTIPWRYFGAPLGEAAPGDNFTFSAWARADTNTAIQIHIVALNGNYQPQDIQTGSFTAKTNWRKFSIDYEIPANSEYVSIRLDNDGGAGSVVWWDDLIFERHVPDTRPKIEFMSPVSRTLTSGDTAHLAQLHQHGRDGLFAFEIPGNAVDLQWIQTQGPIKVNLGPPTPSGNGFAFNGAVEFVESDGTRSLPEPIHDFTVELQFEVDGECVTFYVRGTFKFASYSMFVEGTNFDIQLGDFPTEHYFDLVIDNFSFDEDLIIPIFDLYSTVFEQPIGIDTEFVPTGVQDPDGIDPNGVVLVPAGSQERITITLHEGFNADSGSYDATFNAIPRNGFSDFADLRGIFRREGDDLSIENIDVVAVPGPSIPNNGTFTIPEPLQATDQALSFDIRNFNPEDVLVEAPDIDIISAPEGSNLQFVPDGNTAGLIGANGGFGALNGMLTYDEANSQNGNFEVYVTLTFTDLDGGFNFTDFYSFTIRGAIGAGNPCEQAKRADDPICEGPLLITFPDGTAVTTTEPNFLSDFRLEYLDYDHIFVDLNVQNISDGVCVVETGSVTGPGYSVVPGQFPFTLQPNDVKTITIQFDMQGLPANTHAGMVTITHDDGSTVDFTLTAEIEPFLGIRLFDHANAELLLSTNDFELYGTFNFTPDGPMSIDEGRRYRIFSLRNIGNRTVMFKGSDAEIDQEPKDNTEAFGDFFNGDQTLPPNGSASFGIEFVSDSNSPFHVGDFTGTVKLPFEVTEGEPDSEILYFGLKGEIGTPAELKVEVCPTNQICFAGAQILEQSPVGTVGFSPTTTSKKFTLKNEGEQPVVIDEIEIIVNDDQFDFELPTNAAYGEPLQMWSDKDFVITFTPPPGSNEDDTFFGNVNIKYNQQAHPGLSDFSFGLTAQGGDVEVQNQGNFVPQGGSIAFIDTSQTPGGTAFEEVTIMNVGNATLTGTASLIQIQGGAFTLDPGGTLLNLSVPPNGQQTFNVVLDRSNAGTFAAEISVDHNLPGPDPYTFTVSATVGGGTGGGGGMRVTYGPNPVNHNSTFDFGETPVGVFIGRNFRIWNDGDDPLVVPRSNFTVPAGYQLIETPDGPIPPPDPDGTVHWDNFSVHLKADQAGQFNGAIRIVNNSGHQPNPYTINVTGTVGPQEPGPTGIRVTHGATEVPHLSLFPFGTTQEGTFIGKNFRIWNETNEPLTFPRPLFEVPPGYQLIETPDGPIPPPDPDGTVHWDNFSVHLTANNHGTFNGQVSFVPKLPNGSDLPTYRINVSGNVTQDPACLNDTTGPNLTITEPTNNAVLEPGSVLIAATATDSNGVERVKFFVDNQVIENDTTTPYNVQWDTTTGEHTIKVETYDNCGNLTRKTISVTVQDPCDLDNTGPSVEITNPVNGADLEPGLINITASASDPSGVTRVEFYVNGSLKRNDTEAPWTHGHWFTIEGTQTVQAIAYDGCGNSSSDTVVFDITESGAPCDGDDILPWGSITSPANGTVINPGNITLTATANDNVNVFAVSFEIDGQVPANAVDLTPPYSYVWNATPGNHNVRIRILDVCDNIGYSDSVSFTVNNPDPCSTDNTAPTVNITVPQNGAEVEPGLIDMTATSSDNVGGSGMDRVEFYVNGSLRGTASAPPWTQGFWFTIEGQQTIEVIAYDQCGNNSTDSVTFTVTESGAPCDGDTEPPVGAYTNPTPNSVIMPGPITLQANVTDNVNTFAVSFVVDGQVPEGNVDLAPPYEYVWDATPGVHTLSLNMLDSCDNSGQSPTITVTVLGSTPTTVPNFVGRINGQNISGLLVDHDNPTIDFTWNHASAGSGIERYHIVVQPHGGPWLYGPNILYPGTSYSLQTSDLVAGTSYSIHIRAKSNDGVWGDFVNGGSFTLMDEEPTTVPNFVGRINGQNIDGLVINQTNPTIDFTWNHANALGGIEVYHIVVQPQGGPWLYGPNILHPATSLSLPTSDLVPGTSYSIHIRAKGNNGIWGNFVHGGLFTVQ